MTRLHAHLVGDTAVMPRAEFEKLVELARRSAEVAVHIEEDDTPAAGIRQLAEQGGAFAWLAEEPDIYSVDDLRVRCAGVFASEPILEIAWPGAPTSCGDA
jgi:hypothetical protein